MKFLSAVLLTALLAFATGLYGALPWWSFTITSLIVAIAIHQKAGKAFLSGFTGLFLLWFILAFLKDSANNHVLSTKVAQILPLGGSYLVLIVLTGMIGGLVAGLAALTGSYLRQRSK
ncbi:MAG: hypothetical protein IBJ16_10085 [Chitinophagaceae bacterium]|nr:hypothetical protein [Chitinophagaceae bacterium]